MKGFPLNPRDRVLLALNHQEPDRVPLAIGGGPYGIVDELYLKLVELLQLGKPVEAFRTGHSISYMDDRLLEKLGTDFRYCWPGLLPSWGPSLRSTAGSSKSCSQPIWPICKSFIAASTRLAHWSSRFLARPASKSLKWSMPPWGGRSRLPPRPAL